MRREVSGSELGVGPRCPWLLEPSVPDPYELASSEDICTNDSCPICSGGVIVIGRLATFDSSSVTYRSKPGRWKPAVEWRKTQPAKRRFSLEPGHEVVRERDALQRRPRTNSAGWRMNGSVSSTSTTRSPLLLGLHASMSRYRKFRNTQEQARRGRGGWSGGASGTGSYGRYRSRPLTATPDRAVGEHHRGGS